MKKCLFAVLLVCAGFFCRNADALPPQDVIWVDAGTNDLANDQLANANTNFAAAVAYNPANDDANVLLAATRLALLAQTPAGSNFLTGLGFSSTGRNYYDWTSQWPKNAKGEYQFPANYNSSTALAFYTNTVMPAITASLTNLANITDMGFQLYLPGSVTFGSDGQDAQDVTLDYGDVQVMRAMLAAGEFAGYTLSANNSAANLQWVQSSITNKTLTIQSFLAEFPSFGVLQNKGALTNSETAGTNAIALYFGASSFILNQRTDTEPLFNLSTNDYPQEAQFRTELTNALLSLTTPTQFAPGNEESTIYTEPYFAGNVSLRSLVPKFVNDSYVADTVPDYTFGGILPDVPSYVTEGELLKTFPSYAGIYLGDEDLFDNQSGSRGGSFAAYVNTNGQLTVIGYDYGTGNNDGYTTDGTGFGVLVQANVEKGGDWQTSSSAFDAYGNIDKEGDFNGEIDYSNGVSVYLNAETSLESPQGQFGNSAGYYTGSYSGSDSGSLYAIVGSDGEVYFTTGQSGPGGNDGGSSGFQYSGAFNYFYTYEADGTEIVGIINTNSSSIASPFGGSINPGYIDGIFTNYFHFDHGTFSLSRSSTIAAEMAPVITTDLPPVLTVGLGNTTVFSLGVSGSAPLSYQWYFNSNAIPGATSSTLTVSNNLWASAGSYTISAAVANVAGETNSQVCAVTVLATLPPVGSYAGIYTGNTGDGTNGVTDSNSGSGGAFAAYVSTNGQVEIVGQDYGDGSDDGSAFGFYIPATLDSGGNFQYRNSYVTVYGNVNSLGEIYVQMYYPQAVNGTGEWVWLMGNVQPPLGPFQNTDGYYSGSASGSGGAEYLIMDANGDVVVQAVATSADGSPYGVPEIGASGMFYSTNLFFINSAGTVVSGTLTASSLTINGEYTNTDNTHGTYTVTRSGTVPNAVPVITSNLPANLTIPLGNLTTFHLGVSGSPPINFQWYFNGFPIPGATTNTLVVSNNLWTVTGTYYISAAINNIVGSTNSQVCTVNVVTETNVPTLTITAPTPGELWSNSAFTVTGTASDPQAVTQVVCVVNGFAQSASLTGPTNWNAQVTLSPGTNTISAYALNTGGISSKTNTVLMDYVLSGTLEVFTNGQAIIAPYYNGASLPIGKNFTMTATPINGFTFINWEGFSNEFGGGAVTVLTTNKPTVTFQMESNLELIASLADTEKPFLSITNVTAGTAVSNGTFTVMGVTTDNVAVATVFYSLDGSPYTNNVTLNGSHWSSPALSLVAGTNTFSAYAIDSSENYSVTDTVQIADVVSAELTVVTNGAGSISPNYSGAELQIGKTYSMTVTPANGFIFTNWIGTTNGTQVLTTNKSTVTFTMQTNLQLAADLVDTLKPYLKITNPISSQAFVTNRNIYAFAGVVTDDQEVATVNYTLNGTAGMPLSVYSNIASWHVNLVLTAGTNVFSAYTVATNGNVSATNTVDIVMLSPNSLTVITNGHGTISPSNYTNGVPLDPGLNYSMTVTPANGYIFTNWSGGTSYPLTVLTNKPTVTFTMQTNLILAADLVDTLKPYLKITNPISSVVLVTNQGTYTVMGVATDDQEVATVNYTVNGSPSVLPIFTDITNWQTTVPLTAGTNVFSAYTVATNGNFSATNTVDIVYVVDAKLAVITNGMGSISPNYSGAELQIGKTYSMTVTPANGFIFTNWIGTTNGTQVLTTNKSTVTFTMQTNLQLAADLVDTLKPYLKITNPISSQAFVTNRNIYAFAGVVTDDQEVATVNYTLNGTAGMPLSVYSNIASWHVNLVLTAGTNVFSAYTVATNGNVSATNTVDIVMLSPNSLTVITNGHGTISPSNYTNGVPLDPGLNYSMTVTPANGYIFTNWSGGTSYPLTVLTNKPTVTFTMQTNLILAADLVDTLKPYLKITNPISSVVLVTNQGTYTVMGVATDDQEVATVNYTVNGSPSVLPIFTDITNWQTTVPLTAGTNVFSAYTVATNGNFSATNTVDIVYVVDAKLAVITNGMGSISPNYNGASLQIGQNYSMTVTPANGFIFTNWIGTTNGTQVLTTNKATVTFTMQTNLTLAADLVDTLKPYFKITNPISSLVQITNMNYTVMGVVTDDEELASVNYSLDGSPYTNFAYVNGTQWDVNLPLAEGTDTFAAFALGTNGNTSVTNEITFIRHPGIMTFLIESNLSNFSVSSPQAQISFDGSNYLVVFQGNTVNGSTAMGAFVSPSGNVLNTPVPLLLNSSGSDDPPYLDFDGSNYLVAWNNNGSVDGVFVSPTNATPGTEFSGSILALSQSTFVDNFSTIAYGGGVYFLMWADSRTTPDSIYGTIINPGTGTNYPGYNGDFRISDNGKEDEVGGISAAFDGTDFLAVWSSATNNTSINGRFITTSGGFDGPQILIYTNSSPAGTALPHVVFGGGTNFLVLFNTGVNSNASASSFHIQGRFVTTSGTVLSNQMTLTGDTGPQVVAGADFDGANYLVTWNQGLNPYAVDSSATLYGRYFDALGNPTTAEFPIWTTLSGSEIPTWAPVYWDGVNFQFVLAGGMGHMLTASPNITFTNNAINGAIVSP